MSKKTTRHIVSLSGGKDSAAMAVYLRDRVPDAEYVFCDTDKELPETYEYLTRLEAYLGKRVTVLTHGGRDFDHWLTMYGGYLPSPKMRWCTKHLKLHPFERFVGDSEAISYVGIRADEDREGLLSHLPNLRTVFPFREDGITKRDVYQILEDAGLGLPAYYRWRSRSGCYFCFFQQKIEWVGLLENHPGWFEKACNYEGRNPLTGTVFYWAEESLRDLSRPERVAAIKAEFARRQETDATRPGNRKLMEILADGLDDGSGADACLICRL